MTENVETKLFDGGQDVLVPAHLNFGKFLFEAIRKMGDEEALVNINTGEKYTYKTLTQEVVNLAVSFRKLGMGLGDIVCLGFDTLQYIPIAIAIICTGATLSAMNISFGTAMLKIKIATDKPCFVICNELYWNKFKDVFKCENSIKTIVTSDEVHDSKIKLGSLLCVDYDVNSFEPTEVLGQKDVAVIYQSSGTTDVPKSAQFTHLNCIIHCFYKDFNRFSVGFFCRNWGVNYYDFKTFMFLTNGKKIVHSNVHTAENVLNVVEKYQIDILFTIPVMIFEIIKFEKCEKYNLGSLRVIQSRSAPLKAETIAKLKEILPNHIEIVQAYGMTEIGEVSSEIRVFNGPKGLKPGSVGIPSRGVILKVVDPITGKNLPANTKGELRYKGVALMKGYINGDSSKYFDNEGFFKTGDLGYYDEDGYFYVIDRLKDILSVNCLKVHPSQIEAYLQLHPGVKEAGVIGKPHPQIGDLIVAFIVKQPGAELTEQEINDYIAEDVFPFKELSGGIYFVSQLPRNERGKILRRKLKEMLDAL